MNHLIDFGVCALVGCTNYIILHNYMIETGRWHRPHSIPYDERKCIVCDTIEDEFHFILECSRYADIRIKRQ